MESETVERVTEWDSEPFSGGHDGLRELAEREFTGAVTDGGSWLFMLNGRVLGVFDGDMDRFADADGTAYAAPDRSLPLLFAMRETGGEVQGEYYTEETPISEVDRTLQSGSFTGYVELSENVLSGDYFLAYYGGRRMPVAFIGNQGRRITGDDAFERADDEVGIYRVRSVDLNIVDVPEPETPDGSAAAGTAAVSQEATDTDERAVSEPSTEESTTAEPATTEADDPRSTTTDAADPEPTTAGNDPGAADESTGAATAASTERTDEPSPERDRGGATASASSEDAVSAREDSRTATEAAEAAMSEGEAAATPSNPERTSAGAGGESGFEAESDWRGTTTIPALDPAQSASMSADDGAGATADPEPEQATVQSEEFEALREERDRLQERVEELEAETERLTGERDRLERERDEAAATAEELEDELEELEGTVAELEAELEAARSELDAAQEYVPDGDHELPPEEAMAGTNLFVRYERKGGPTLEDAHNGDAGREAVNDNLRLEYHTEFEDDGAVVDGESFDEWLRGTIEYGFVEWLTRAFVHDVRETRNQTAMGKLYDAVPDIDRVELRGSVELGEEADEESAAFDVVLRDRMGQPLFVTDLNDSRDPATEPMLESLIRNATPVAESNERLSAAFFVTTSYYEPGALETAEEATGGGFLNRGKNKSFVKLSRKDGYHLCLVETRENEFHVSVPEL